MTHSALPPGGELLYGANAIAEFLGMRPRQVYSLIFKRAIPHWHEGRTVVARRATLRAWIAPREAAAQVPQHPPA